MRTFLLVFGIVSILLTGCTNNEQLGSERDVDPKPIRISTKDNRQVVIDKNPSKDYIQSDEEGIGQYGSERNIFESVESRQISQQLARRDEVIQSRVAVTPNRVIVFASLNDYPNDIEKQIEDDVKKYVQDKQIIVFTDEAQWERMRHLESSLKAEEIGEDMEQYLERYFNIDIKD